MRIDQKDFDSKGNEITKQILQGIISRSQYTDFCQKMMATLNIKEEHRPDLSNDDVFVSNNIMLLAQKERAIITASYRLEK